MSQRAAKGPDNPGTMHKPSSGSVGKHTTDCQTGARIAHGPSCQHSPTDCMDQLPFRGCTAVVQLRERELLVVVNVVENVADRKAKRHASACHTTDAVISTRRVSRKRSSRTIQDWGSERCVLRVVSADQLSQPQIRAAAREA